MLNFESEDCVKELWNGICCEIIDSRLTHKIKVSFFVFRVTSIVIIVKCKHLLPYDLCIKHAYNVHCHSSKHRIVQYVIVYVIVIPQLRGILLIYTPLSLGPAALRIRVYISAKSLAAVV